VTSGGGGYYTPISTTSTTVSTSTSLPTTQPGIEALLTSLESELRGLLSQAAAQGISVPDVASFSSFTFTRNLTIGSKGADVAALQHYLNTHNFSVVSTPGYAGSFGYETKYFGVNTQAALARFQKSVDIAPPFGYFGPITRTYVNAHE
jgi:peptidoglycan hydrolase-like protein with peptidoglycan-binding domain